MLHPVYIEINVHLDEAYILGNDLLNQFGIKFCTRIP